MANLPLTLNNQPKPLVCNCGSTTYDVKDFQRHLDDNRTHQPKDAGGVAYIIGRLRDKEWKFTKDDVIATHILFTQIRRELEKRGIARQQAFQEYDSLGLKCSDISKSRPRHYRAAMVLAKALMVSLKDEPKE